MAAVRSRSLPTRWNSFRPSQCIERKIAGFIADLKVEGVLPHAGILRQPKMNFKVEISMRWQSSFGCHPMIVDYSIRFGLTGPGDRAIIRDLSVGRRLGRRVFPSEMMVQ